MNSIGRFPAKDQLRKTLDLRTLQKMESQGKKCCMVQSWGSCQGPELHWLCWFREGAEGLCGWGVHERVTFTSHTAWYVIFSVSQKVIQHKMLPRCGRPVSQVYLTMSCPSCSPWNTIRSHTEKDGEWFWFILSQRHFLLRAVESTFFFSMTVI